jgi:pseudouridine-5'-phosphate glycosidase
MQTSPPLDVRPTVAAALEAKHPVVALVSSPIAHTLPWPANLDAVRLAEAAVRQEGVTLAVVAVWRGRLTVGLDAAEVETLARGGSTLRASRRDLATAVVRGITAATTVSASMYLAHRAGIRLVATGAIGGAHGTSSSEGPAWDISADLVELLHTPVAVVTAGARSVHYLGYTAEVLETFRVPVVGYGTDSFPAFYMRAGNYRASVRSNTPAEVAALLKAHWGMEGAGVVVAQPTPAEVALSPDELVPGLGAVEEQAAKDHVDRKDLSPFLMDRLNRLTRGKALRAYQAILAANARLAAQVARELAKTETASAAGKPSTP